MLTIGSSVVFLLQESVIVVTENEGSVSVRVEVLNQQLLTSSISVVLTPRIAPESYTPAPDQLPHARANTRKYQ